MNFDRDLHRLSPASRRAFLASAAGSLLGVSLRDSLGKTAEAVPTRANPAKRVISIFLSGGMPQQETFSPVPDAPDAVRGLGGAIATSADGVQISSYLPRTAQLMHHAVAFRSLNSNQGAHAEGRYFMKTNWRKRGTIQHPHLGSWASHLAGRINPELPGFVASTALAKEVGAGFLGADHEPLVVRDPEAGITNATLHHNDSLAAMEHRLDLARQIDADFRAAYASAPVQAHGAMFEATSRLMRSTDLAAFDVTQESAARRKVYGDSRFGLGCLLARRLSASGVRYVEVESGGWDTHTDHFDRVPGLLADLDRGLSALLGDLAESGELDETLVTVTTEFGRTPDINHNEGRDHYPQAFAGLIAGGGIRGGQVWGKVDAEGRHIEEGKIDVTDFNATVGWALGLPIGQEVFSPSGRPFTVANEGKPLTQLFG